MRDPTARQDSLQELRLLLTFLQKLWGLLAGISAFFPLSNVLVRVIPLQAYDNDGVFDQLSPALITTLTTVVTLFVVLVTFSNRHRFATSTSGPATRRRAWLSLSLSVCALCTYLAIYTVYRAYAWEPWGWGSGDPRKLLAEIPLLITYGMFFSLLTRAFMLVGMREFFGTRAGENPSV